MAERGGGGGRQDGRSGASRVGSGRPGGGQSRVSGVAKTGAGGAPAKAEVIAPARRAAFRVLLEVEAGRGHSDELLHAKGPGAALERLSEQDRRLAMALVLGVLRWQIALDARLRGLFSRPDAEVAPEVMAALRMGAFQLLHMDRIPVHAALSESVALARAAGQEHATGMVNAVLRKVATGPKAEAARVFERPAVLAERLGHPAWLVERWARVYGTAAARQICEADQAEPGDGAGVFVEGDGLPVMDAGSRLVAELAAVAAPAIESGALRVWDCCAAPGGKTAVLATRLRERAGGVEVLATDVSARRLRAMEERLGALAASAGMGGPVRCVVADARAMPVTEGLFELVLCDVPCSGTGTLGRNPEIRLRLVEAELGRQAERQRAILGAAMERVVEGGRVVYSTCSLEPEECEAVVEAVLAEAGEGWRRMDVEPLLAALRDTGVVTEGAGLDGAVREGALRTLPGVQAMDGFFAVVLERN